MLTYLCKMFSQKHIKWEDKMKKFLLLSLSLILVLGTYTAYADDGSDYYEGYKGVNSDLKLIMNGENLDLQPFMVTNWVVEDEETYESAANVFKLRDVAAALKDTNAKFNIVYNGENNSINIIPGQAYTPIESDLQFVDIEKASISDSPLKIFVNGKETKLKGIDINGHNYFKMSVIRNNVGNFMFKPDAAEDNLHYITFEKSDIPEFDQNKFEEILAQKDYSLIFNWGPWCYYSQRALPIMKDLQVYYEEQGYSIQIIGIVNQYDNYKLAEIEELFGGEFTWVNMGATTEAYTYLEKIYGERIGFFPLRFIMNKEGKMIGHEFFDYYDELEESLAKESGVDISELTEEQTDKLEIEVLHDFLNKAIKDGVSN